MFNSAAAQVSGTTANKFTPIDGVDNMVRNGISTQVKTKHYCISGMKGYDGKSLEVCLSLLSQLSRFVVGSKFERQFDNSRYHFQTFLN